MYYPLSEITPNLYTNGIDLAYKQTGKPYKGYYYSTTDGKYYTGSTFSPKAEELVKVDTRKSINTSTSPTSYIPIPSENDYKKGYITRYATKRVNCGFDTISEIDKLEYDRLENNILYTTVSFNWKITGPLYSDSTSIGIIDTNQKTLTLFESKIPDITSFFRNFAQYAKIY